MTKKWVLAVALLGLAISMGCRNVTGVSPVTVVVSNPGNLSLLYVTQVVQFTAKVTGTGNTAVTWSLSGTGCTGSACGTLDSSGKYTAPPGPLSGQVQVTITATSQADSRASGSAQVTVQDITVQITPNPANVGVLLTQQFVAVALPDDAPQTFTWTNPPTCTTPPCGTIVPDPNNPALATYTAPNSPSPANDVNVIATSTVDTSGIGQATATVVKSRLGGNSNKATNYAFHFSGFDPSGKATALAGSFVVDTDGKTIISGVADELTTGGRQHCPTVTGSYSLASNDSNNQGTVILNLCGATNTYTVVLDANGDLQMIESDSNGTGSGVAQTSSTAQFNTGAQTFVLGFTGVDSVGNRVGYVGLLPMDGSGNISGGLLDINDNGNTTNVCGAAPCNVSGTYSFNNSTGLGQMTLTSAVTMKFDFFVSSGQAKGGSNALNLYAISTDPPDALHPAVSGTMVFQDPKGSPYNTATFKGTSVVQLTGVDSTGTNSNVSLTLVTTDGSVNPGNLSGNFDQNNGGTILSVSNFSTGYTFAGTGSGRYTFNLLGNPNAPVVPPVPFVLYASGANKGFLLDQSSASVMTGTMYLQKHPPGGSFSVSDNPGTYAAATTSSGTKLVDPIAANLLLTFVEPLVGAVSGNQYDAGHAPPGQTVTGASTLDGSGTGTFTLTAPPAEKNLVIYAIDVTHLLVMDVTGTANSGTANASIVFAQQ